MGNWIAREPWASLRYAHGYFRLAFQAGGLFGACLPTNLTPTRDSRLGGVVSSACGGLHALIWALRRET
jgi:hypothetical protein